jgi:hypothetical protein
VSSKNLNIALLALVLFVLLGFAKNAFATTKAQEPVAIAPIPFDWMNASNFQFYETDVRLLNINYYNPNILYAERIIKESYNLAAEPFFLYVSVTGSLYFDVAFDQVWKDKYEDLKTKWGTFEFYHERGMTSDDINHSVSHEIVSLPEMLIILTLLSIFAFWLVRKNRRVKKRSRSRRL